MSFMATLASSISKSLSRYLSYISGVDDVQGRTEYCDDSRTELDSHANMPVLGSECYIIAKTGKSATVQPYRPDYQPMDVPIIHGAIQYDCPYTGESSILVVRNAL